MAVGKKIRVMVIDDSAAMRSLLTQILNSDSHIEVIATAPDPVIARQKIKDLEPDVLTLDVEMPKMDGITFLEKLMRGHPMPVVMVSSLTQAGCEVTLNALELGAVDFVPKPTFDTLNGIQNAATDIRSKVRAAALAKVTAKAQRPTETVKLASSIKLTHRIIAIGASTGGTEAIKDILMQLPADSPGIVIVQHMPPGFTTSYAARLDAHCPMHVREAQDGDRIIPGQALLAPGGFHMAVVRSGAQASVRVYDSEPVSLHKPSVDVLFLSCAEQMRHNATGLILTGMGSDGATGIKAMHDAGAHTIAQDEATCVVFGMPKEAIATGGVDDILPLPKIAQRLVA
ncbi:MAG: Chemotaxis response regulator protein-glutamate methylesterase [Fimbriimonadaceae bacterium]|nr:Chemotaxis response regulator protein-glutamate methylesterase [Fimbriimonadaceae bacterium]